MDASISLATLVETMLGFHLEKSQTVSDWMKRPLNAAQLQYACEDVLYLHDLYRLLKQSLEQTKKYSYFYEDCQTLSIFKNPIDNYCDKNLKVTDSQQYKNVFRSISEWREDYARERNIPKGWVLKDHILKKIAHTPNHENWINSDFDEKHYLRYKTQFIEIHEKHHDDDKKRYQISQSEKTLIDGFQAKLKRLINRVGLLENIPVELLCNQRTLKKIAESMFINKTWVPFKGWRGDLLNIKLKQLFESQFITNKND